MVGKQGKKDEGAERREELVRVWEGYFPKTERDPRKRQAREEAMP